MATRPLFGCGASKIMRCFPLILPNHASSAAPLPAASGDGSALLSPAAATVAATRPINPRRAVRSDIEQPSWPKALDVIVAPKYHTEGRGARDEGRGGTRCRCESSDAP